MKNKLQKVLLILIGLFFLNKGNAQSVMVGVGGVYGTDIEQFAPNLRLYYGVNEALCFGPEFAYFPSQFGTDEYDIQLNEYGFVAHYIFEIIEKVGVYPLLGLNYSVETKIFPETRETKNAFGLSGGVGGHLTFGNFLPYAEYKFITGELSQSTISLGVIYNIHLSGGHESEHEKEHH